MPKNIGQKSRPKTNTIKKNSNFFDPIPIRESFLGQKSTQDQYNIKKNFLEDQYNTNTKKMVIFGQFGNIFSKKSDIFGHFLPNFGKFWQILVIFDNFLGFFGQFLGSKFFEIFFTNITNTNMLSIWPTPISPILIYFIFIFYLFIFWKKYVSKS